jgi:hypothetical protein
MATTQLLTAAEVAAKRLRGILRNHPKAQSVRLTRSEAEAIAAAILDAPEAAG